MNKIFRSPIFYMGNKFKLLKQLIPLFPKECDVFIDLFGGSGVVSMNYQGKKRTIYNEFNNNIVELIKMVKENDPINLNNYWISQRDKYGLRTKSDKEPKNYKQNAEPYNRLRKDYNTSERNYKDLFLLSCYSINHLIRFNQNSEFNASNGSDSYNEKNYEQVCDMHNIFQNVEIFCHNALELKIDFLKENDFVYCDPPYLNTLAVYNEKRAFGNWSIENDYQLFNMLETLNNRNIKWGLSNVFVNRGVENTHLIEWCEKNDWYVHHLNRNYNPFSRGNSDNDEVYICNYKQEGEINNE